MGVLPQKSFLTCSTLPQQSFLPACPTFPCPFPNQSAVPAPRSAWIPHSRFPQSTVGDVLFWSSAHSPGSQAPGMLVGLAPYPSTHPRSRPDLPAQQASLGLSPPLYPSHPQPGSWGNPQACFICLDVSPGSLQAPAGVIPKTHCKPAPPGCHKPVALFLATVAGQCKNQHEYLAIVCAQDKFLFNYGLAS